MDISSPLVVVPVLVAVFFGCILWATRGDPVSEQPKDSHTGHMVN
jgi:hypothetical protein